MNQTLLVAVLAGTFAAIIYAITQYFVCRERRRIVQWLKLAAGPTDNYPAKLALLIDHGEHWRGYRVMHPRCAIRREG